MTANPSGPVVVGVGGSPTSHTAPEHDALAVDGRIVRIRPVDPQDATALRALYDNADDRSLYLRFFAGGHGQIDQEARRLTPPSAPDHPVMVALDAGRILGYDAVGTVHAAGLTVSTPRVGDGVLVSCITALRRLPVLPRGTLRAAPTRRRVDPRPHDRRHPRHDVVLMAPAAGPRSADLRTRAAGSAARAATSAARHHGQQPAPLSQGRAR
jgi:hypothetical protein